jgi:hypothetical protein
MSIEMGANSGHGRPTESGASHEGTVLHAPGDVRFETCEDPTIVKPTDAVIRIAATCVRNIRELITID